VPQTTVNFSNQRLAFPTTSEQETRQELMKRAFDSLIELALANLVAIRARRRQLEQLQSQLLQKKARVMASAQVGLKSLLEPTAPTLADCATIQRQLWDLEAELVQVRADTATIEQLLAKVVATLNEPESYLRMERVSLILDHMNVVAPPDSPRVANTLIFDEALLGNNRRLTVVLIRFPSSELLSQPDFFQEAQRLLTPRIC
jgi:septal ring factor EnvC (AmiA/AmiB activator)